jgi:Ca-activated chloride channel family protein
MHLKLIARAAHSHAASLRKISLMLVSALLTLVACTTQPESPGTQGSATGPAKTQPYNQGQSHESDSMAASDADVSHLYEQKIAVAEMAIARRQSPAGMYTDRLAMAPGRAYMGFTSEPLNTENYAHYDSNPIKLVGENPVSTFSIDVDTGAYANVRRMLNDGYLPPQDAVRVEELINYFSYDYETPASRNTPFSINMEMATTPWNANTYLLQVGLKGYEVETTERPAANLVFLVDVSGSMQDPDKLPLLKNAFRLLTKQLGAEDSIALVVYAGSTGIVLEPTPGDKKATILSALDQLTAGGSTNGAAGIDLAYQMAQQAFVKGGINRIILATDGDFNVGTVNFEALIDKVEKHRRTGISLTTLGFGTGNFNDQLMEQLADAGNGNYAYIDGLGEARKVLVEELSSTLQTIAKDVKIQIEFNPAVVAEYRLIGYENRMLRREDFNNDKIDAGEIGAGHTVTALYEITLVGGAGQRVDPLRYGKAGANDSNRNTDELAFVRLRYKAPDSDLSELIEAVLKRQDILQFNDAGSELQFAAAVAAFGQQLRGGDYLENFGFDAIRKLAGASRGTDPHGYRGEFITLVELADSLSAQQTNKVATR